MHAFGTCRSNHSVSDMKFHTFSINTFSIKRPLRNCPYHSTYVLFEMLQGKNQHIRIGHPINRCVASQTARTVMRRCRWVYNDHHLLTSMGDLTPESPYIRLKLMSSFCHLCFQGTQLQWNLTVNFDIFYFTINSLKHRCMW